MVLRVFGGWETMGKKSKLVARASLRSSQCHGSTVKNAMKGNLSNTIQDVMQANHQHDTAPLALTNPAANSVAGRRLSS